MWLNPAMHAKFYFMPGFLGDLDVYIMSFVNYLHRSVFGSFFNLFFSFMTNFGEPYILLVLVLILFLFRKSRKCSFMIIISLVLGMLITNILLKPIADRGRPFWDITSVYYEWWIYAGKHIETSFSFPSGHSTAIFAALTPIFLSYSKKLSFLVFIPAFLVAFSRVYLMVHYPTDVIAGAAVGFFSGLISYIFINFIYRRREYKINI